jgi:LytS/YehU family sensor histidine kinase
LLEISIKRIFSQNIFHERSWIPQIFIGTFIYLVNILFFYVVLLFSKYNEKSVSEERLKNLLVETRLNTLKAYINPHFLFNSLNSVNALIKSDPDKAREMLINISDYFRDTLKQKDNDFVTVEEEIAHAFLYLGIEKVRFGDRIQMETKIDRNAYNRKIPATILQPLFENIIKHAVAQTNETIFINFEIVLNNFVEIILSNNYDENYHTKTSTGIGVSTIVERLNLMYNTENLVEIIKKNNTFKIIIKIPSLF